MIRPLISIITASLLVGCGDNEPAFDIWTAAAMGNQEAIRQHAESGTDIDAKEPAGGSSPLIIAAVFGHAEAARVLVANGASLDLANNDGSTALHVAAFFCHPEAVELLLDEGAARDVRNRFGRTPLESVTGAWSGDLEDAYKAIAGLWGLQLDLERIKRLRPQIAHLIRQHSED